MDNDESNQPTFMRARSTNDFGRTNLDRTSGLGARGLAAKFSVKSPRLDDESLNVVCPFVACFQVYYETKTKLAIYFDGHISLPFTILRKNACFGLFCGIL